jgi:hypothetical protein
VRVCELLCLNTRDLSGSVGMFSQGWWLYAAANADEFAVPGAGFYPGLFWGIPRHSKPDTFSAIVSFWDHQTRFTR